MTDQTTSLAVGGTLTPESFADFVERLKHNCRGEGVSFHYTANALFTVQAKKLIYGFSSEHADKFVIVQEESEWFSPEDFFRDAVNELQETLNRSAQDIDDKDFLDLDLCEQFEVLREQEDITVTGYQETWEYVNAHLTKEAAEAFIERKKHDYRKGLRVYVEAQIHCWEFEAIKNALMDGKLVLANERAASVAYGE